MSAGSNHQRKYPVEPGDDPLYQVEREDRIDWERKRKRRKERPDYDEIDDYDLDDFSNNGQSLKKSKPKKRRRARERMRPKRGVLLEDFYNEEGDFY